MENSVFSSPSRKPSLPNLTAEDDRSSEESGWTEYLGDFSAYNRGERDDDEDNEENSSFVISESMVSDAGSGPEWRQRNSNSNINNNNHSLSAGVWSSFDGLPNVPKKLNFKKKRTQEISHDDSLEDTASSPVNSPKITVSFKRMDINSKNMDEHLHNHMGKGIEAVDRASYNKINEGQEINSCLANSADYIELKNKGLCLVPLSMVMDSLH